MLTRVSTSGAPSRGSGDVSSSRDEPKFEVGEVFTKKHFSTVTTDLKRLLVLWLCSGKQSLCWTYISLKTHYGKLFALIMSH